MTFKKVRSVLGYLTTLLAFAGILSVAAFYGKRQTGPQVERLAMYKIGNGKDVSLLLQQGQDELRIHSHAVMSSFQSSASYSLNFKFKNKNGQQIWSRDIALKADSGWHKRNDRWRNAYLQDSDQIVTNERVTRISLPKFEDEGTLVVSCSGQDAVLVRLYEVQTRSASALALALKASKSSNSRIWSKTVIDWDMLSPARQAQALRVGSKRLAAEGQSGIDFETATLYFSGYWEPVQLQRRGLQVTSLRPLALQLSGKAKFLTPEGGDDVTVRKRNVDVDLERWVEADGQHSFWLTSQEEDVASVDGEFSEQTTLTYPYRSEAAYMIDDERFITYSTKGSKELVFSAWGASERRNRVVVRSGDKLLHVEELKTQVDSTNYAEGVHQKILPLSKPSFFTVKVSENTEEITLLSDGPLLISAAYLGSDVISKHKALPLERQLHVRDGRRYIVREFALEKRRRLTRRSIVPTKGGRQSPVMREVARVSISADVSGQELVARGSRMSFTVNGPRESIVSKRVQVVSGEAIAFQRPIERVGQKYYVPTKKGATYKIVGPEGAKLTARGVDWRTPQKRRALTVSEVTAASPLVFSVTPDVTTFVLSYYSTPSSPPPKIELVIGDVVKTLSMKPFSPKLQGDVSLDKSATMLRGWVVELPSYRTGTVVRVKASTGWGYGEILQ